MFSETVKYFWLEYSLLPAPQGYALFSRKHIGALIVTLAAVSLCLYAFGKWDSHKQTVFLRILAFILPVVELFKTGLLVYEKVYDASYYPLYMCSMGMYLFPLIILLGHSRAGSWLSMVSMLIIIPGSFSALLFPNWIGLYPLFSFFSIYSYLWHGILLLFPLCLFKRGAVKETGLSLPKALAFPLLMMPFIHAADLRFGQNYWFFEYPEANNPFYGIYESYGYPVYFGSFVLMTLIMSGTSRILFWILQKWHEKNKSKAEGNGIEND